MSADRGFASESKAARVFRPEQSPLRVVVLLAVVIFAAEIIAMAVLFELKITNYVANTILDATMMLVLILPGLYYLHLNPIQKQIEEHAQTTLALRKSEAQLKKVMEALPVGVWIIDNDGTIINGNPACEEIWGGIRYVGAEEYGEYKGWRADTGAPMKPEDWAAARVLSGSVPAVIEEELKIVAFDGTPKTILNSAVPILDENDQIEGAVVVNQDISVRKKMEKEVYQANELLEQFFNSIHTMIAFIDRDFNFIRVNAAYAAAAGKQVEDFPGQNHFALYPHEENEAIFKRVVETGEPFQVLEKPFEYPEYPERGVTYWDWSLQPVGGEGNQVESLVFSLLDVTERKRSEMKLASQNQELRDLTQAERRLRKLAEGLVQAVVAVNTSLDLDEVLCSILLQIGKAVPYQGADIILVMGKTWRAAAAEGFEQYPQGRPDLESTQTFAGYPLLKQVCTSQEMLVIELVDEEPGWRADPDMAWVRSYTAIPLAIGGDVIGVIELYHDEPAAFGVEAAKLLLAFAAPAALALNNARLYQAEADARQIAETLSKAAMALSQTLELKQVIQTLLEHIRLIVPADTAGVTLMDADERWTVRDFRGYNAWANRADVPQFPLDGVTDSVIRRIKQSHKGLIIPNVTPGKGKEVENELPRIHSWMILPIIASDEMIGYVELGNAGSLIFTPKQAQWVEVLTGQVSVAIQNAWLFEQVRASSERLQSLARKTVELQESERYHIARELHDEAGQSLSSLKLTLGQLEQDPDCPAHMRQRLQELKGVADSVLEELHRLAMDLRPVALDHLGLVAAVGQYANRLSSESLKIKFKAVGFEDIRLPSDVETSLYRIIQEALTNVINHACAHNVGILLERAGDKVRLFVEDDGVGFEIERAESGEQLGLVGMRERAEMFGGSLSIESSLSSGTSIIVEVPYGDSYSDNR